MRQVVACAICSIKDWIDDFYPRYVWKEAPPDVVADTAEHNEQDSEADDDNDAYEEHIPASVPPNVVRIKSSCANWFVHRITMSHKSQKSKATNELLLDAVRKPFRAALSQEKGRLETLNLDRPKRGHKTE